MEKRTIIKITAATLVTGLVVASPVFKQVSAIPSATSQAETTDNSNSTPPPLPDGANPDSMPAGNPPGGNPPDDAPGGGMENSSITLSGANTADNTNLTYNGSNDTDGLSSSASDENTVLATNGGSYTITNATLNKTGNCSNNDSSNFYAVNAILAATADSSAYVSCTKLTSASEGSNGLFATGSNARIYAKDISINTTGNSSRGLDATYEGTVIAEDIDITTSGEHCGAIATDRGGGYISVENATLNTSGQGSPLIYSTGVIEVKNAKGEATGAQITGMEGLNTVRIKNSTLTGSAKKASEPVANGVILYQSTSGDSSIGTAVFEASDSTLKSHITDGAMFYVTNTNANIILSNTKLDFDASRNTLLTAGANDGSNNWGTAGKNGGNVTLTADNQVLEGDISCDGASNVDFYITNKSSYTGSTINDTAYTGDGGISISLGPSSKWIVTGNSVIKSLNAAEGAVIQDKDGNTVTIKSTGGNTVVKGNSNITITTGSYLAEDKTSSAGSITGLTIDKSGFDSYFSGNTGNSPTGTDTDSTNPDINTNPGNTGITKLSATKNSIKIKWKKAVNCSGYIVYRSTKKNGNYKQVANIKNSNRTTYTNKNLKKNKKYFYKVQAYTDNNGSIIYGKKSSAKGKKTLA